MDSYSVVTSGLQAGEPRCTCEPPALFCPNHGDDRQLGEPATLNRHELRHLDQRTQEAAHG